MGAVVPVRVGDGSILVETTVVAGSEPTSRASDAAGAVVDAFDAARDAIVDLATSTWEAIEEAGKRAARPAHVEVEFGLKFSAKGNVIVAGAAGEATLRVKLTYDAVAE